VYIKQRPNTVVRVGFIRRAHPVLPVVRLIVFFYPANGIVPLKAGFWQVFDIVQDLSVRIVLFLF
jgi:hypothetical protein